MIEVCTNPSERHNVKCIIAPVYSIQKICVAVGAVENLYFILARSVTKMQINESGLLVCKAQLFLYIDTALKIWRKVDEK